MARLKRLEWTASAFEEFAEGLAYIAEDSLAAALAVKRRIDQAGFRICRNPALYRPGLVPGTRECAVTRTTYTLIFEERRESILILHCWHQRRQAPSGA